MTFSGTPWPECGIARFLTLLDGPWATLIIRELLTGPARFTELRDALTGISAHTLTNRLRRFETYGLVTRTVYAEIPPRVVYELTASGEALRPVLEAMNTWAATVPMIDAESAVPLPASCVTGATEPASA
ncbi:MULTISPECIES: winged helix-turn-helix transcriptional regulator [Cryobacterium]|uniref:Transcriptional regulator n=1 Tax=Cryobacterium zongtaii TaxID=1259217 RepID=A0A2S3Z716_9MICO|nr:MULTISPECIES: helix-turn-helix domain-containing protein [Cryobacterium]POH61341.1 transcriptional regulator [Cryobacterium zongtaii]POH64563.1 transcriptional regulator [Cryobacterium zongtaii]TFC46273.1 transcriptional regulator [Cryobacterium sp. TMN-39-2]